MRRNKNRIEIPEEKPESWATFYAPGQRALVMYLVSLAISVAGLLWVVFVLPAQGLANIVYFFTIFASVVIGYYSSIFLRVQIKMNNTFKPTIFIFIGYVVTVAVLVASVVLFVNL